MPVSLDCQCVCGYVYLSVCLFVFPYLPVFSSLSACFTVAVCFIECKSSCLRGCLIDWLEASILIREFLFLCNDVRVYCSTASSRVPTFYWPSPLRSLLSLVCPSRIIPLVSCKLTLWIRGPKWIPWFPTQELLIDLFSQSASACDCRPLPAL